MTAEKIPSWFERLLLPALNEMKGELKAINTRIDSLEAQIKSLDARMDTRINSLDARMDTRINSLDAKIDNKFEGLDYRFEAITTRLDSLEKRIPVIEEITVLKLKIADIEKRLAVA